LQECGFPEARRHESGFPEARLQECGFAETEDRGFGEGCLRPPRRLARRSWAGSPSAGRGAASSSSSGRVPLVVACSGSAARGIPTGGLLISFGGGAIGVSCRGGDGVR